MREDGFRAWLAERGAKTEAGRNTRSYAVRTIENNLAALGSPHPDLDAAWQDDRFSALRVRLRELREDFLAGGTDYRILMPQSKKPANRLSNSRSWLGQYGQFLENAPESDRDADRIRRHVLEEYIEPAREREDDTVEVSVRTVNDALGLNDGWPNICQALTGSKFLTMADLPTPQRIGKIASSATSYIFDLTRTFVETDVIDRFRVSPFFAKAVAEWSADQREAFRQIALAVHESGMDWWAVNNSDSPIRFGRKTRDTARAKVVQGFHNPKVRNISFNDPAIALDLGLPAFTIDAESAERLVAVLQERAQDIARWRPFSDARQGLWPDEGVNEIETALDPTPIWIVTARWGGEDGVQRFLDRSEWGLSTDTDSPNNRRVRDMQPGDRIVLRDYFHQTQDLPFDANGERISAIRIRAMGTVTEQHDNGLSVGVAWYEPLDEPRTWYFYTQNDPVWWLKEPGQSPLADRLRAFLLDGVEQDYTYFLDHWFASDKSVESESQTAMPDPTNLILYGPPGTGKTYATAREAVSLCGEAVPEDRDELMALYRSLHDQGRIGFVTFHQNFAYEDFVEGLRPVSAAGDGAGFGLEAQDGIFKQMASLAALPVAAGQGIVQPAETGPLYEDAALFRMSLGDAADPRWSWVFDQSIAQGYALFSFVDVDWSPSRFDDPAEILGELQRRFPDKDYKPGSGAVESTHLFRNVVQHGDIIVVSKGRSKFRAIGVVEGGYEFAPRSEPGYSHRRKVRWIWHDREGLPVSILRDRQFGINTISRLRRDDMNLATLDRLLKGGVAHTSHLPSLPHVLIIDEINRANISKVFGELITLLEPDKRLGMPNALTVRLPYSKTEFGVPANLHVIGTMNTADRSIAQLDTALRRRFIFRELAPDPTLLRVVEGIALPAVLTAINERIEYLVDREHRIGHAFFIHCRTRADIDAVMRDKVIPLLQEYFFEDWSRIAAVVGPGFIEGRKLKAPPGMKDLGPRDSWAVRASFTANAYDLLVGGAQAVAADEPDAPEVLDA